MNSGKRIVLLIILGFFWLMVTGIRTEAGINLSSNFSSDHTLRQYDGSQSLNYAGNNTLRFNFKYLESPIKVEGSLDWLVLLGDSAAAYTVITPDGDNLLLIQETDLFSAIAIRKLYLSLLFERCTLTLGRQIINYGVGYVFSPIDRFSTVDLEDVAFSRKGSDIFRVQVPLGDLAGLEGVTTLGTNDSASAVKIFANLWEYDWSLTGIYKKPQEETLIGLTFKGDLGMIGIHGELVGHFGVQSDNRYFERMLGADYSFFGNKLLLLTEYYYNGNPIDPGTLTPQELLTLDHPFPGKHYLFTQASYAFDEIRSLSINGIHNLTEKSWVGTLQFSYNILQNTDLLLYTRYYSGNLNGPDFPNSPKADYAIRVNVKF